MRRIVTVTAFLLALTPPALADPIDELARVYPVVRQGLCTLKITCALPADALWPAGYNEYRLAVERAQEALLLGPPVRMSWVYDLLARRFAGEAAGWPRVKIVVDARERPALVGWEQGRLRAHVRVVSGGEGGDALSTLTGLGLPLAYFRGPYGEKLYLVAGNDLFLEPKGPLAESLKPLVLTAIDLVEAASQRQKEVR